MQLIPNSAAIEIATAIQTALAASKLRLFNNGFTPTPSTVLADLTAVECTFSGYTSGGYALATWLAPIFSAGGGAQVTSPQVFVEYVVPESDPVSGTVGGWFVTDTSGNLIAAGTFNQPVPVIGAGDGFTITVALVFGNIAVDVLCWVLGIPQN